MSSWKGKTRGGLFGYKFFISILKYSGLSVAYFFLRFVVIYFFPSYSNIIPVLPAVGFGFLLVFPFASLVRSINKNSLNSYWAIMHILIVFFVGVKLIISYDLLGAVLLYLVLRFGNFLFLYFALWKIGYKVSFVPNTSDIKLFYKIIKIILLNLITSIRHKF